MRWIRIVWALVLLVPVGFFADRFCYVNIADPSYHALLWMHERFGFLIAVFAMSSAASALFRFVRIQGQLRALLALRTPPPKSVSEAFRDAARALCLRPLDLSYIQVPVPFCFTIFGGRIVLSQGFLDLTDSEDLALIALHEALHVLRRDPIKALLWHLFFATFIVPGFEVLEDALYRRREQQVDRIVADIDTSRYSALVQRVQSSICLRTPAAAFRSSGTSKPESLLRSLLPSVTPVSVLVLLLASHVMIVVNLPYLQSHHC